MKFCIMFRTLRDTELENLILKDPNSRSYRMRQLGLSATLASSGCSVSKKCGSVSLLPSVKLIAEGDILSVPKEIGSGRFGTCFMQVYTHFQVCLKVLKHKEPASLCTEANIISKFCSTCLPYLLGVCLFKHAIVTSFHGLGDTSVTLHQALAGKPRDLLNQYDLNWMYILQKILSGIEELHSRHKILHNDLKSDNVILTATLDRVVKPVIIDFGKACEVVQGKLYRLTLMEREQYKINHPQIAPEVRDGLSKQSEASDIYSYRRIVSMVSKKTKEITVQNLSKMCMMYNATDRPLISSIKVLLCKSD